MVSERRGKSGRLGKPANRSNCTSPDEAGQSGPKSLAVTLQLGLVEVAETEGQTAIESVAAKKGQVDAHGCRYDVWIFVPGSSSSGA
jgi:hypothetical protein